MRAATDDYVENPSLCVTALVERPFHALSIDPKSWSPDGALRLHGPLAINSSRAGGSTMSTRRSELDQSRRYGVVHGECWYRFEQDGKKFDHQGLEILTDEVGEDAAKHQPRRNDAAVSQMPRSSAAERMRRTRERRRAGIIAVVSVEIR